MVESTEQPREKGGIVAISFEKGALHCCSFSLRLYRRRQADWMVVWSRYVIGRVDQLARFAADSPSIHDKRRRDGLNRNARSGRSDDTDPFRVVNRQRGHP